MMEKTSEVFSDIVIAGCKQKGVLLEDPGRGLTAALGTIGLASGRGAGGAAKNDAM